MKFSGSKTIALLEAVKGISAVLIVIAIHVLESVNLHTQVVSLLTAFHINLDGYYSQMLLHSVDRLTRFSFNLVTVLAICYAMIRFIESYGLWHEMRWTEWFAFLSGAIYLPFEIYEVYKNINIASVGVLMINLIVVSYMYTILKKHPEKQKEH